MRKVSRQNPIIARGGWRILAAASLAASLSLFGCTTDRIPGSGAPERSGPGVGPAIPSATPGSESNDPIPVHASMASSMSFEAATAQVLRRVDVDALATAAANASFRGRVLGAADPAAGASTTGIAGIDYQTGQFINPAVIANPQYTVNSSINSVGVVPAITGDFGSTGGAAVGAVTVGAVSNSNGAISNLAAIPNQTTAVSPVINGTSTGNATVLPSVAATQFQAPVFLTPNTLLTPTNSAIQTTVGQFAAGPGVQRTVVPSVIQPGAVAITNLPTGSLTPTVSSGAMTTPLLAANPPIGSVGRTTATTSAVRTSNVTSSATVATTSHPLVISQGSTGITISNVGNATSAVTSTKSTTSGSPIILNVKP